MSRKGISIDEAVFDRAEGLKRDDESWTEFVDRLCDALESDDESVTTEASHLTEDNIDDIAAAVERRMERALENAMRRQ